MNDLRQNCSKAASETKTRAQNAQNAQKSPVQILSEIDMCGAKLILRDGGLIVRPASVVPAELMVAIREHKQFLISILSEPSARDIRAAAQVEQQAKAWDGFGNGFGSDDARKFPEPLDWRELCIWFESYARLVVDGLVMVPAGKRWWGRPEGWCVRISDAEVFVDKISRMIASDVQGQTRIGLCCQLRQLRAILEPRRLRSIPLSRKILVGPPAQLCDVCRTD